MNDRKTKRDSEKHAATIRAFWIEQGKRVKVWVNDSDEICSDLFNGKPLSA